MAAGLIGRKLGMTRIFADDGSVVPVSVIEAAPNTSRGSARVEQDGYAALQIGAGTARRSTKPVAGQFKHLPKDLQQPKAVREFRVDSRPMATRSASSSTSTCSRPASWSTSPA